MQRSAGGTRIFMRRRDVHFRVSQREYGQLVALAKDRDETIAGLLRWLIRQATIPMPTTPRGTGVTEQGLARQA
jgi:hypothetical protein